MGKKFNIESWGCSEAHPATSGKKGISKGYQVFDFKEDEDFQKQIDSILNYLDLKRFATTKGFVSMVDIKDKRNKVIDRIPFIHFVRDSFEVSELSESRFEQFKTTLEKTLEKREEEYTIDARKQAKRERDRERRQREKMAKLQAIANSKDTPVM